MDRIYKKGSLVVLVGIILLSLLFSACSNSMSGKTTDPAESVAEHNMEVLCGEGYSEEEINQLMDILKQLNQPVALGTEKITEAGTYIQVFPEAGDYSEEYLWFLTDAEEKYYAFIQKDSSMIFFVCKGELEGGDYIYRTYR